MRRVTSVVATLLLGALAVACGPGDSTTASPAAPATTLAAPVTTPVTSTTVAPSASGAPSTGSVTTDAGTAPTTTVRTFIAPSTSTPAAAPTTTVAPVKETSAVLQPGDEGVRVIQLQARLKANGYDPGPIDGQYGPGVQAAVRAFQRVNDLEGDGDVGPLTMAAFDHPKKVEPMRPEGPPDRVEVSVSRKLLVLYKDGAPAVITHVSSGSEIPFCENGVCGDAVTPIGDFSVIMKIDGWENGPLGAMYNSVYFWPAYAIHGSPNVPDVGASHGCVRIPMNIAEYFPSLVKYGEPVYIMK